MATVHTSPPRRSVLSQGGPRQFTIIGAGATGLALGYLLQRAGHQVTLVEGAPRPGGLLATFDVGHERRLEHFYHHFFTHDAEINWLLEELGLSDRIIFRPTAMGMYCHGQVYPFQGAKDLLRFRAMSLAARLRFGASSLLMAYWPGLADREELGSLDWFRRWAGKEATEAIWEPLLRCKFGDAAPRIPLAWMAGRLRQRARSRRGGQELLGYVRGSLQVLVDRLVEVLQQGGATIHLGTRVRRLLTSGGRVEGVSTDDGPLHSDAVIATIPTPQLSELVAPHAFGYAQALDQIEYLGAVCVVLSLREQLSPVYWLNVADPGFDFGGVIEQTNFVPPEEYNGQHLVYTSRYLPTDHPLWGMPDEQLVDRQLDQLSRLFGRDVRGVVNRHWVFRGRYAAPVAEMGFWKNIPAFKSPLAGLYVANMCHVYPDERSVNNSVRVAAAVMESLEMDASMVPAGLSLSAKYGR